MRRVLKIAILTCSLLVLPSQGIAEDVQGVAEFVESVGIQAVETDKLVGLSVAVARGDEVLIAKGFGLANVELSAPVTASTVFRVGSITKEFTAAAVLLLVEDGKIRLDDPLTKQLPNYPAHGGVVTVRQLLQHTSGIHDFTPPAVFSTGAPVGCFQGAGTGAVPRRAARIPTGRETPLLQLGLLSPRVDRPTSVQESLFENLSSSDSLKS